MGVNFDRMRELLAGFDFHGLFIEELGWSHPPNEKPFRFTVKGGAFDRRQIAQLAGVSVLEVTSSDGKIPDSHARAAVHKEIAKLHHENLLIFVDGDRSRSLWRWVKRQDGKTYPRDHHFFRGQPGDLFISKLGQIVFDISAFDAEGNVPIVEVADRLRKALDVERTTKRFFTEFETQHVEFIEFIRGVRDERQRRWYASVLLNRLMFIYFLQRKGFLDKGKLNYLQEKLAESQATGKNAYFRGFLRLLFFEGFAKPEDRRSAAARKLLGSIKYLNGGLFLQHRIEQDNPEVDVPDKAFENLFALFARYSWNLNDTPGGKDDEINPDVLGYIFEKYINQKAFGAYYTRPEITEYLCERTIHRLILDAVNTPASLKAAGPEMKPRDYASVGDLLLDLDAPLCKRLLLEILPGLSLLDPACGSGAFLVAAMKTLVDVYAAVIGRITFLADSTLTAWFKQAQRDHKSIGYFIKRRIITDNLFGVDIMEEAVEIARLRLFLALVAAATTVDQLEPLPNIDFNILPGNSLVGLMRVDSGVFGKHIKEHVAQGNLFRKSYTDLLAEKNRLIETYRHTAEYAEDLTSLRDDIDKRKAAATATLDELLTDEFTQLGIRFEQATWDAKKNDVGKSFKRPLSHDDIRKLRPFHWGYEFDEILNRRGGFDAIITNPPWEIFKPNSKEFFEAFSDLVTRKKMTIHEFEKEQAKLLQDPDVRKPWLEYLSGYPHVSAYFRAAPQYRNQIAVVNGKKAGTDINLYKLFLEQCCNLLRIGGRCGIIVPGGVYNDLGAKQLRELLFSECEVDAIFGLSNEKFVFEGVHHSQKICITSFGKGRHTNSFTAAFRINPREAVRPERLGGFLHSPHEHLTLSVPLVRKLSPDSLSLMEFKTTQDVVIAEKMLQFPLLGEVLPDTWNFVLTREFDISKGHLLQPKPGPDRLPLFTGRMFHQFTLTGESAKFWIEENAGRRHLLRDEADQGQTLDYQGYRWVHRRIARTTDSRTFISTIAPRRVFTENNSTTIRVAASGITCAEMVFLCAVTNSFCLDWMLRLKVDDTLNMFHVYSLPVPRLNRADPRFVRFVNRAARLICTTPDFDELAREVGLNNHKGGATDASDRGSVRAELDGLVAHLYGLTEEEFAHILSTFPLVPDPAKIAAQNALRNVEKGLIA